jgi:hypothetical protein
MKLVSLAALGATAALSWAPAQAAPVDLATLQLNGSASIPAPAVLRLTDSAHLADPMDPGSNVGYASSAFIASAFSSASTFTSSFTFTMTGTGFDPQADGLTFMIQNNAAGAGALGGGGGGIGADGIDHSVGVGFQSWDNDHATIFTDGDVFGGTMPLFSDNPDDPDNPFKHPNFLLGGNALNVVNVSVAYDGTTLSYSALNTSTGQAISDSLAFDLASLGPQVYFGFTGATGLSYSIEDVSDWDLAVVGPATGGVPEPASWGLMIVGFGGMGAVLRRRRGLLA